MSEQRELKYVPFVRASGKCVITGCHWFNVQKFASKCGGAIFGQQFCTLRFEKIESISNIAVDTFKQKQSLIYAKSIARSLMKYGTTAVLGVAKENSENEGLLDFLYMTSLIVNQVTEVADIRTSKYFPSNVYISGIDLPEGDYDIIVNYFSSNGNQLYTKVFENYNLSKNKLNLLEAVCLK